MPAPNQTSESPADLRLPRWMRVVLIGRNWKFTVARLVVFVAACFVLFGFILLPVRTEGISMLPAYRPGSVHFVNRLAYLWHPPQRGDIVGIRFAREETNAATDIGRAVRWLNTPHIMLSKRIIGLPGETVAFVHGQVLINGKVLNEPYEKLGCDWNQPPVTLGPNQYYVVGDNRSMPPQDHVHGIAERSQIIGKLLL